LYFLKKNEIQNMYQHEFLLLARCLPDCAIQAGLPDFSAGGEYLRNEGKVVVNLTLLTTP
jgi:hypothetical protein